MPTNYEDVTPKQVASDIQACIDRAKAALGEISCLMGDEWPELEDPMSDINLAIDKMEGVVEEVRDGRRR